MSGADNSGSIKNRLIPGILCAGLTLLCFMPDRLLANDAIISSYAPNEDCSVVAETDAFLDYRCPGVFDVDVWFSIGDARWTISFHKDHPAGLVLSQGFNRTHHPDLQVEWRFDGNRPMAALQLWRFYDASGELDEGAWVITRIAGDDVCHMGFVDNQENEDALGLARRFADANALSFSCSQDPVWIGNRSPIEGHTHHTAR